MRTFARASALATLLAVTTLASLVTLAAARSDHDFEFDEAPALAERGGGGVRDGGAIPRARRPRRYVYEPHNALCSALQCGAREVCVLREGRTALCARRRDLLRRGDVIVSGTEAEWERADGEAAEDDVFYEAGGGGGSEGARCVGCPPGVAAGAGARFLCGSDNRTYSSLCRLDLHNCVRRATTPVRPACRGFCPCRPRAQRPSRPACALDDLANRLLDWFSVLMEEAGEVPPPAHGFPSGCKAEVRWMFAHLDTDGDGLLSAANLYALRHDERERCLRPFLAGCGAGAGSAEGGRSGGVSRAAWCACLRRAARPCRALARAHHPTRGGGAYVPSCDARGFYQPRQCHVALGVCWCVDPHGVELPGSRTKGAPACPGEKSELVSARGEQAGRGAPDDDEDGAGSGDNALTF